MGVGPGIWPIHESRIWISEGPIQGGSYLEGERFDLSLKIGFPKNLDSGFLVLWILSMWTGRKQRHINYQQLNTQRVLRVGVAKSHRAKTYPHLPNPTARLIILCFPVLFGAFFHVGKS